MTPRLLLSSAGIALALLSGLVAMPSLAVAQNRALLVGIGAYADPQLASPRSGTAALDIAAMETLLTGTLGFAQNEIRVLRDGEATKAAILDGITDWLRPDRKEIEEARKAQAAANAKTGKTPKKTKKSKKRKKAKSKHRRSFLYFAGNGDFLRDLNGEEADGLDEALIPHDAAVTGSGADSSITGMISDDEFSAALKTLEGRRVTVVLDTGHSGQVTRSAEKQTQPIADARVPAVAGAIRSTSGDPMVVRQKGEGRFVETSFTKGSLAVWSAVSASQTALLDTDSPESRRLFTRLFVDGHQAAVADRNGNGILSNTELLVYLKTASREYCASNRSRCEMGLTPRLDPSRAHRGTAVRKAGRKPRRLTMSRLTDFLVRGNSLQTAIEQIPPSPVRVGATDIRFRVTSQQDGSLVLLNLTDKGQLIQLFPNHFAGSGDAARSGRVSANVALTVPDSDYGLRLTATDPAKGHIIAVFARDPVEFGKTVSARSIGNIPRSEALGSYLPELAAALTSPLNAGTAETNSRSAVWSVATYRYEILP